MLAETSLPHRTILMDLTSGDQFDPGFLKINPNAKMPAIVDHDAATGPTTVFESGAILLYLAQKTNRFAPVCPVANKELLEWMFWQAGNLGPMAGQLSHFVNYAPAGEAYALARYQGEYERTLRVLENRLEGRDYVLGDYSIVDMMVFPWAFIARPLGVSLDAFPRVADWRGRIKMRPAVRAAINLFKDAQFTGKTSAQSNKILFNQRASHLGRRRGQDRA